ncbi:MAG: HAD family hydrolase [Thermoplasmata archaeon]|nr:HAD family hydrolase [Thermoplasmata archaeon]
MVVSMKGSAAHPRVAAGKTPPPEGLRAVLFDLDDTLYDHAYALNHALRSLWREEPAFRHRTLDAARAEYARLLEEFHLRLMAGKITENEARVRRFQALFRWAGEEISLRDARVKALTYRRLYLEHQRPVPGAVALVRRLAGSVRLGIVSNNRTRGQLDKLRSIGLTGLFDVLITSEEVGAAKPDPEIFQAALDGLKVARDEVVMVGDSWPSDVLGARAAGLTAVWFNRGAFPNPDPSLAVELTSLRPASSALEAIFLAYRLEED